MIGQLEEPQGIVHKATCQLEYFWVTDVIEVSPTEAWME